MIARTLLVALVLGIWPDAASAQIYAWRDAKGTLVLSDRRIAEPMQVYEVVGAPDILTTTPSVSQEAERFEALVQEHAARQSLPPELVRAVIQVESGFNPKALSPKGAIGLMQLMPETARALGVRNPWDPAENIRGGTTYLRQLLDRYDGRIELALAAYNAGPGAVDRYDQTVPPYRETQEYVRKVRRLGSPATTWSAASSVGPAPGRRVFYKSIQIIDGRVVPHYSTVRPASGTYEVIQF
jgi:soluble lytic murein transglycosylase-like protein